MIRVMLAASILFFVGGCSGDFLGLKYPPTESQQQIAEMSHQLARKVNVEGANPLSTVSRKLVDGTGTTLTYMGRPDTVPDLADFDTINEQARTDAETPAVDTMLGSALDIGLAIAGLIGGAGGLRLATSLRRVYAKAKGFTEVVRNAELFKTMATPETWEQFKRAQVMQTDPTRKLVAEVVVDQKVPKLEV